MHSLSHFLSPPSNMQDLTVALARHSRAKAGDKYQFLHLIIWCPNGAVGLPLVWKGWINKGETNTWIFHPFVTSQWADFVVAQAKIMDFFLMYFDCRRTPKTHF